ncbi:GtrA family protein [hydrothermal vent metagenome]|uniref:GtrA family protein n=1 Tax=hydrothermal vent metagenome TaxID=652676 RepID=A0A1W1B9X9_9ZZZZ
MVGIVNTIVGYSIIMILFHLVGLSYSLSYFLSYVVGIVVSFFLNRNFVFFSQRDKLAEFMKFLIAFGVSYLVSYFALVLLMEWGILNANISFFIGMVIYSTLFYLLNRYITFKGTVDKL